MLKPESFREGGDRHHVFYGQALLWVGYIGVLTAMWLYEADDSQFTYGLCVFLGIFTVWALWSWKTITGSYFDLYSLFLLSLVLFSGGQALLEVFNLNERGILNLAHPSSVVKDCILLVCNCLMSFHTGALVRAYTVRVRRATEPSYSPYIADACRSFGIVLSAISVGPACYALYWAWTVAQTSGYMGLYQQSVNPTGAWYIVVSFFIAPGSLLITGGLFLLAGSRGRSVAVAAAWILLAVPACLYLVIGHRNVGLQALVALLWLHAAAIKPLRRAFVVTGAVVALLILPALASVRDDPGYVNNKLESMVHAFGKLEQPLVKSVSEMGGTFATIVYTAELVPHVRPFDWGVGYFYALTTALPSLFWDVHPAVKRGVPTDWLINQVDPYVARAGGGIGFSVIAEAYLNFSWYGAPLAMSVLGFAVSHFVLWVMKRPDALRLATEAILISFVMFFARADSHSIVRPLLWTCVVPYLVITYLARAKASPAQAHARDLRRRVLGVSS